MKKVYIGFLFVIHGMYASQESDYQQAYDSITAQDFNRGLTSYIVILEKQLAEQEINQVIPYQTKFKNLSLWRADIMQAQKTCKKLVQLEREKMHTCDLEIQKITIAQNQASAVYDQLINKLKSYSELPGQEKQRQNALLFMAGVFNVEGYLHQHMYTSSNRWMFLENNRLEIIYRHYTQLQNKKQFKKYDEQLLELQQKYAHAADKVVNLMGRQAIIRNLVRKKVINIQARKISVQEQKNQEFVERIQNKDQRFTQITKSFVGNKAFEAIANDEKHRMQLTKKEKQRKKSKEAEQARKQQQALIDQEKAKKAEIARQKQITASAQQKISKQIQAKKKDKDLEFLDVIMKEKSELEQSCKAELTVFQVDHLQKNIHKPIPLRMHDAQGYAHNIVKNAIACKGKDLQQIFGEKS